ncbi:MAG: serine/threonine-protein kinase, partial [Casimicrobium sp.]
MVSSVTPPDDNDEAFDADRWRRIDQALDQALELEGDEREALLASLDVQDATIASDVRKLLARAEPVVETSHRRIGLTTELATIFSTGSPLASERGFDGLLQRALRAEKATLKNARHRGELCGAWRLDSMIGIGGMGEVWLAERADGLYNAQVAVKFLRTHPNFEAFEVRFAQERALLARLNHSNIARLIDAGRKFGTPFLVLEYVDGAPLLDYVVEHAPTIELRLHIFRQIVEAVAYAHTQLIVHRDLKPSNVLVTAQGQVKLLDFGVAGLLGDDSGGASESSVTKISGRGLTIEYAAPEQISGDTTGIATDVYSLGALGFHILTGHRAHLVDKSGRAALEHAVLHTDAPRVSEAAQTRPSVVAKDSISPPRDALKIGADIDAIFARAMRRDPAHRYRTAEEFLADLRRFAEKRPIATRRNDRVYRGKLWIRRNWLSTSLAATLLVSLVGGLAVSLWQADRARIEAARATKTADYLVELLRSADPDLNGGQWPTSISLIDRARDDVGRRFADDPATEARLSSMLVTTLRSLSRDADAIPIAQRAVELAKLEFGANSIEALRATRALATAYYWNNDFRTARTIFASSVQPLLARLPAASLEAFEVKQFGAESLCAVYVVAGAESMFQSLTTHPALDAMDEPTRRWTIANNDGKLASCVTRSGNWQAAADLLRKHTAVYENPPTANVKDALYHLEFGLSVQTVLGDTDNLEVGIRSLI